MLAKASNSKFRWIAIVLSVNAVNDLEEINGS